MSKFYAFMKKNKIEKENVLYPATESLRDENGKPLMWELRPLTTKEYEALSQSCMREVPVKGKAGQYRPKLDTTSFQAKMICKSIVSPDLDDSELQDSYGVMGAEELLREMINIPGEFTDLAVKVQQISGFKSMDEEVNEAKN